MIDSLAVANAIRALILPPTSLFLLAFIGWLVQRRFRQPGRIVIFATLALSYVLCAPAGADLLVRPLENQTHPLADVGVSAAQAIVVLSAGRLEDAREYGGFDIPDYVTLGRLSYAARLQHQSGLPVLVSGGIPSRSGASHADAMARMLREEFLVPVIWIDGRSENTEENARFSSEILLRNDVRRVLLVTDAMHMPRAERSFRHSGIDVIAAPTLFQRSTGLHPSDFIPSVEGLRRSRYALYEMIGLLWYHIRYGI